MITQRLTLNSLYIRQKANSTNWLSQGSFILQASLDRLYNTCLGVKCRRSSVASHRRTDGDTPMNRTLTSMFTCVPVYNIHKASFTARLWTDTSFSLYTRFPTSNKHIHNGTSRPGNTISPFVSAILTITKRHPPRAVTIRASLVIFGQALDSGQQNLRHGWRSSFCKTLTIHWLGSWPQQRLPGETKGFWRD